MKKEKVSFIHLALGLYMIQSGIVILSLPNTVAEYFGTNGWVAILIGSLVIVFNIFLIYLVFLLGQGKSVFTIMENTLPKILRYPLYLGLMSLWGIIACLVAKKYTLIIQMTSFPSTPQIFFKGMLLILAFLSLSSGVYNMFKVTTLFYFLTLPLVILINFSIDNFEFIRLTPYLFMGSTDMFSGSIEVFGSFLGFELMLLIFPYVDKRTNLFKAMLVGHCITTFVYLNVAFVSFGMFGYEQLQHFMFAVMDLLGYMKLPFIERLETLIYSLFLYKMVITIGFYYWGASKMLHQILSGVKQTWLALVIMAGSYLFSERFYTLFEVKTALFHAIKIGYLAATGFPLFLIILLLLKNIKRRSPHAKHLQSHD